MAWIAAIAAVGGGLISGMFSQSAAGTQAQSAQAATQAELQMQQNAINQVSPWRNAGMSALNQYSQLLGLGPVDMSSPASNPYGGGNQIPMGGGAPGGNYPNYGGGTVGGASAGEGATSPSGPGGSGSDAGGTGAPGSGSGSGMGTSYQIRPGTQASSTGPAYMPTPGGGAQQIITGGSQTATGGPGPTSTGGAAPSTVAGGNPAQNINQWLTQLPGYQFTLGQGMNAIENSAAARGMQLSSNNLQNLEQYGQGLAGTTFNQWLDRLNNLSTQGANASTGNATNIMQTSGMIGSNIIGAGNAQAAGQVAMGNALTSGTSDAMNNYLQQQMLSSLLRNQGGGGGGGGGGSYFDSPG